MNIVCPTITAEDSQDFKRQLNAIKDFATRIHIDLMDGILAPTKSPTLEDIPWPTNLTVDVHLMFNQPSDLIEQLIALKPNLVIIHAEARADLKQLANTLHSSNVKAGLALLPATTTASVNDVLGGFETILIFGGRLGYHGGQADLSQADKIAELKSLGFGGEIAWDGGIDESNIKQLADQGISLFNTGNYIMSSESPEDAYTKLMEIVK